MHVSIHFFLCINSSDFSQALTAMVRELRRKEKQNGLVLANGGMVTYQYVVCLSSQPRNSPYPDRNPLPDLLEEPYPTVEEKAEGAAVIEVSHSQSTSSALTFQTYTVEFNRDGSPHHGHIVGRLESGNRFLANHGDESTLLQLSSTVKEQIGRKGMVRIGEDGRNLFVFDSGGKL